MNKHTGALIVGDPLMPSLPPGGWLSAEVPQLPGARQEARIIANLLKVPPLIGAFSTGDVVTRRMQGAQVIHFATHGLDIADSSLSYGYNAGLSLSVDLPPGAIVLGASSKKYYPVTSFGEKIPFNGFLTSGKILFLNLNAELVTLSACDTARGRANEYEPASLPKAFIAVGARTVVSTLWSIPDGPTSDLMVTFYKALISGRSKASALRHAILATKDRHPHPQKLGSIHSFWIAKLSVELL